MIVAALLAMSALNPAVEIELAGGAAHSLEVGGSGYNYPFASPAVQGRLAVDFGSRMALGGMFFAVMDGEARNGVACCGSDTGNQAFSATATLATLRVHSSGPLQFWAEGGAGTGHLISLQADNSFENPPLRGTAGLALRLAVGARQFISSRVPLGVEFAWMRWSHVEQGPGSIQYDSHLTRSGLSTSALLLLFSVGFTIGH